MNNIIKLLFYSIVFASWFFFVLKKQGKWQEKIPDFPEEPDSAASPDPEKQPPVKGYFPGTTAPEDSIKKPARLTEEQHRELYLKKMRLPELIFDEEQPPKTPSPQKIRPTTIPEQIEEKQNSYLKNSLQEGIIWSIVLGPPRSKLRFGTKNLPLQR
jgi:hypothetical protein